MMSRSSQRKRVPISSTRPASNQPATVAPATSTSVILDEDEWPGDRYQRGDPVLHIELRRWADLLLIAPCDANTLAKLAARHQRQLLDMRVPGLGLRSPAGDPRAGDEHFDVGASRDLAHLTQVAEDLGTALARRAADQQAAGVR